MVKSLKVNQGVRFDTGHGTIDLIIRALEPKSHRILTEAATEKESLFFYVRNGQDAMIRVTEEGIPAVTKMMPEEVGLRPTDGIQWGVLPNGADTSKRGVVFYRNPSNYKPSNSEHLPLDAPPNNIIEIPNE